MTPLEETRSQQQLSTWLYGRSSKRTLLVLSASIVLGVFLIPLVRQQHRLIQVRRLVSNRENALARGLLEQLRLDFPENAEVHLLLARTYRRLGEFQRMIETLRMADQLHAPQTKVQLEYTLANAQIGRVSNSEHEFGRLLQNPGDDGKEICEAFTNGYFLMNHDQAALQIIDAWKRDFPDDPLPLIFEASYFERISDHTKAISVHERILHLVPQRHDLRVRLGEQFLIVQEPERARHEALCALKSEPNNVAAKILLAKCLHSDGNLSAAIDLLKELIVQQPNLAELHTVLGRVLMEHGRLEEAFQQLSRALCLRSFDHQIEYSLATALVRLGREADARKHFERVALTKEALATVSRLKNEVRHSPLNADLRYEIGKLLLEYDDPGQAEIWLRSVLEIDSKHQAARADLAAYYQHIKKPDLARAISIGGHHGNGMPNDADFSRSSHRNQAR